MKVGRWLSCLLVVLVTSTCTGPGQEAADLVLLNGEVFTLEEGRPWASAVAIKGNEITAVLDDDVQAEAMVGPATRVVDLEGKMVVPGFIDAHIHFAGFAAQQHDIMLMNVDSDEGLLEELRRVVPLVGPGEWITGGDWSGAIQWLAGTGELSGEEEVDRWEPDRFTIDDVTPDNPCFLTSYDGDLYLANTAALTAAGLESATLDGMEVRDGIPTGLIRRGSPAIDQLWDAVQPKSEERRLNEYRAGLQALAEMGIVEIHDMVRSFSEVERFVTLQEQGELTARVWIRPWLDLQDEVFERGLTMGDHPTTKERDYYLRYGGFKSANDGFLGSRGAMLFEPYNDRPDYMGHYQEYNSDSDRPGSLVGNPEVFYNFCKAAIEHGFSVDSHAIGDRGISEVIDVLERLHEDLGTDMNMFRIIHAEIVQPREFERMRALNLIAETNPSQIADDMRWLNHRLGSEREQLAFPFRTFIDNDIVMNFGSDAPGNAGAIFFSHPKYVLNAAVHRTNNEGEPQGGWTPHHKITVEEAIRAFSLNAAYACMREDSIRGSIEAGKLADMTVIDRNIVEHPDQLLDLEIEMTIVDGKVVFER